MKKLPVPSDLVIFSIRPYHANNIFSGKKTVELRRIRPKKLQRGSVVIVYVSSPQRVLRGAFKVAHVIQKPVNELWRLVQNKASVTQGEFYKYYKGSDLGVAIFISQALYFSKPIKLQELRRQVQDFNPPQSFRYANIKEIQVPEVNNITSRLIY